MKRLIVLLVLLAPSIAAASYPHGYKLTHDSNGVAYTGGYYTFDAYRCKWLWYAYPKAGTVSHSLDNHSINYSYTYNYNNASANAGTSQGGLTGAFRYDDYNVGGEAYDSLKYVSAARSIDERGLENQRIAQTQAGYTRDKLLSIQAITAASEANARVLTAASSGGQPQVLQQFNSYSPSPASAPAYGGSNVTAPAQSNLTAIAAKCQRCHNAGAAEGLGGGNVLPAFSEFTAEQAKTGRAYITRLDAANNCAVKAQLTHAEQQELVDYFCRKSAQ